MTRITRYFLDAYLRPLFFSFSALAVLVMLSELMERLDKFMAGKAGLRLVAEYMLSVLPTRTVEILPVAALLAALFSLGNLSRRQEITAAMSGGIHPWKCAQPLLICGLLMTLFSWALSEGVVPLASRRAKQIWNQDVRHLTSMKQTRFEGLTVAGEAGALYSIAVLDTDRNVMENVLLDLPQDGLPRTQIQAKVAGWAPERNQWVFKDGVKRTFAEDGMGLAGQENFAELWVPLAETPQDLVPNEPDSEEMSYKQLNRRLRRLRVLGISTRRQEVELHMKLAFPWANFIVLLLGIPLAFQKTGGKVKAVGFALGVAFVYFGLMQVGRALGQKPWCPPIMGAWLANFVFLSFGSWLFLRMKRLS